MKRIMLKAKIHRATVTGADLNYEGSITIDEEIMEAADIKEYEMVQIYDITNGNRLETYAIKGKRGSREIIINGAAARLVHKGDLIIIANYATYDEKELLNYKPRIIYMDRGNVIKEKKNVPLAVKAI